MIRRLRRKFIIVAMCSMLAVLAVMVCIMNVSSYRSMVARADRILQMLADNGGHFPTDLHDNMRDKNDKNMSHGEDVIRRTVDVIGAMEL